MTTNGKPLKDFEQWDINDLRAFLDSERSSEGFEIEYKGAKPFLKAKLSDGERNDLLGKPVSAFANTQGGFLFVGIEDRDTAHQKPFIDPGIPKDFYYKSRLVDILTSCTNPYYLDVRVQEIELEDKEKVVFIAFIPEFIVTPLQNKDFKYYARADGNSHPIPENHVRALYSKRQVPNVDLELYQEPCGYKLGDPQEVYKIFHIKAKVSNKSHIRAKDLKIRFTACNLIKLDTPSKMVKVPEKEISFPYNQYTQTKYGEPLFGDDSIDIGLMEFRVPALVPIEFLARYILTAYQAPTEPYKATFNESSLVKYKIYADNAPPKPGQKLLSEILPPFVIRDENNPAVFKDHWPKPKENR